MKHLFAALCITLLLGITPALAALPATISYQGYLTNSSGVAVNSTVSMVLSLYNVASGGSALWTETQPSVVVTKGVYTVQLGSITTLNLPFDTTYYLGVAVGGEAQMTPRLAMSSAPTVFRAMSADKLNQACADNEILKYVAASSTWSCAALPAGGSGTVTSVATGTGLSGGTITGSGTIALANTAVTPGSYTRATVTVDQQGRLTSASSGGAISLTSDVTGTVPVANGGTGTTTLTGYVKGSGTSALTASATIPNTAITGLGTAATLNVGTSANNVVQLNGSSQLPAVDGSQLAKVLLLSSTDGLRNVKAGTAALSANTTGESNTAIGDRALIANTTGQGNTAIGDSALVANTAASGNTAIGSAAMMSQSYNNGGAYYNANNVAIGNLSLMSNNPTSTSRGINNTAIGTGALESNTTGSNNLAIGSGAGSTLSTGDNNIDIGNQGNFGESSTIRIGTSNQTRSFIAGIRGVTTDNNNAIPVMIDSTGQLGTVSSSIRYKEDVNDMGDSTSRLFGLRPVTFRYKTQPAAVHFGLIAEEVDQVMPELVVRGNDGQIETVAYHELTPMLLNELQKLKAENCDLKARLLKIEKALGL